MPRLARSERYDLTRESILGPQLVQVINNAQTVTEELLESLFRTLNIKDVKLFGRKDRRLDRGGATDRRHQGCHRRAMR